MNFPEELKYTREHEWVKVEQDVAYIGITDFAQRELGDIVFVDIPTSLGQTVQKDDVFGIIEAVKTVSDLFMPISGELLEINTELENKPEILNSSPYENWIIKVKIKDLFEIDSLLDSIDYRKLIKE